MLKQVIGEVVWVGLATNLLALAALPYVDLTQPNEVIENKSTSTITPLLTALEQSNVTFRLAEVPETAANVVLTPAKLPVGPVMRVVVRSCDPYWAVRAQLPDVGACSDTAY